MNLSVTIFTGVKTKNRSLQRHVDFVYLAYRRTYKSGVIDVFCCISSFELERLTWRLIQGLRMRTKKENLNPFPACWTWRLPWTAQGVWAATSITHNRWVIHITVIHAMDMVHGYSTVTQTFLMSWHGSSSSSSSYNIAGDHAEAKENGVFDVSLSVLS